MLLDFRRFLVGGLRIPWQQILRQRWKPTACDVNYREFYEQRGILQIYNLLEFVIAICILRPLS